MAWEARIETRRDDRPAEWGQGPWTDEPDRVEWVTAAGLPAIIKRVTSRYMGHLCGYVAVPPGHRWHGDWPSEPDVHGGVTYAAACHGEVCHVPAPGEPDDVWWVGFDAGHDGDGSPGGLGGPMGLYLIEGSYKSVVYMRAECERLAAQAAAQAAP